MHIYVGLQLDMLILSPFLYKGFIIEYFKGSGKIPNDMELIAHVG
jgi:hypothetical protein